MDPLKLSITDVEKLSESDALEVLAAHVKAKQRALPEAMAGLAKSKALAHAAKKALYQLRSSGVELTKPVVEAVTLTPATATAELTGLLSPVLGTGEQMLVFGRAARGGGVEFYQCVLHDEFGVQTVDRADTNRSRYRRQLRATVQARHAIEVPFDRVLHELACAWGQNLRSKTRLPESADQTLQHLRVTAADAPLEVPAPEADDAALAAKSVTLHDEPEIHAWLPAQAPLAALGDELAALRASNGSPEAIDEHVQRATGSYFTPAVCELYARRLWRQAEFFAGTEREAAAAIARAQARLMFHQHQFGAFGLRLFQKVIALARAGA